MSIKPIQELAKQKGRGRFFPQFRNAQLNILGNDNAGFYIQFASDEEALAFSTALLAAKTKDGEKVIEREVNVRLDGNKVMVTENLVSFAKKLPESNFNQSQENEFARKDQAAKASFATAVNAATFGVPVVGYALNGLGRFFSKLNDSFLGVIPVAGFALRFASRACLDSSAGILANGYSIFPNKATNEEQAKILTALSSDTNKKHNWRNNNVIGDGLLMGFGAVLKTLAIPTNLLADSAYRLSKVFDKRNSTARKFFSSALKTVTFPLRAPEMLANWLIEPSKHTLPKQSWKINTLFSKLRIGDGNRDLATDVLEEKPQEIKTVTDSLLIQARKQKGLIFDESIDKKAYAKIAEVTCNGRTYKAYVDFSCSQVKYKYSGNYEDGLPADVDVPEALERKITELKESNSSVSWDLSREEVSQHTYRESMLQALIKCAKTIQNVNGINYSAIKSNDYSLVLKEDCLENNNFLIKTSFGELTCKSGNISLLKHGRQISGPELTKSVDFHNSLVEISQQKGEFKSLDKNSKSLSKPVAFNLKKIEQQTGRS